MRLSEKFKHQIPKFFLEKWNIKPGRWLAVALRGVECPLNPGNIVKIVESNIGKLAVEAIYVVDTNFKIWALKGEVKGDVLGYYRKFPLAMMNIGSMVHDKKSFLIKTTERTGVIVVMKEEHHTLIAAAKLKERLNAFSEMYELDRVLEILEKEGKG